MVEEVKRISLYEESIDMCKVKETRNFFYRAIKRTFDIFASLIGIIIMIPTTIVIKIAYMLTGDFQPIIYSHIRIGKDGSRFNMYKYRSMVPNADEALKEILKKQEYEEEWKKNQKFENDPRITRVGKILRKTSLDELPQMINVFIGNMSIIGPRPLVPGELDKHNGNHEIYEEVRPGITSWWASHGRSSTTYEERLALEYYYIQNRSLLLDLKCIIATIKAVITKTGAK